MLLDCLCLQAYNGTYTAAVHWYTNDNAIWSVEFNQIKNMQITFAKIAFLVGAAPGQDPKYRLRLHAI